MAIKVGQAFERTSANPIDESLALTKAKMLTVNDNVMPAYYFTICQDDGKVYLYDKSATASITTGKFKEFSGGGGGDVKVFTTTAILDEDINDTTTVVAADLPGITWSDLKIGASIIKDSKGTLGLVTAINGTTDVTVTTATTSTPVKELTQAQYDALSAADKNNGTIYMVTDAQILPGARQTNYSTSEQVVGQWIDGRPLYQKTWAGTISFNSGSEYDLITSLPANIDNDYSWVDDSASFICTHPGYPTNSGTRQSGFTYGSSYIQMWLGDATTIRFRCDGMGNGTNVPYVCTLKYTKTTD